MYEAEALGAILALWLICTTPETLGRTISLYIDNKSIIKALSLTKATSGQHLIDTLKTHGQHSGVQPHYQMDIVLVSPAN
jgi:hypothetical protein